VTRINPFPTAKPFWAPTIWSAARFAGGDSGAERSVGHVAGAVVAVDAADAAVDAAAVVAGAAPFLPAAGGRELQAAQAREPATARTAKNRRTTSHDGTHEG
jgi:hypothetical protein